jgi:hypothetical protein
VTERVRRRLVPFFALAATAALATSRPALGDGGRLQILEALGDRTVSVWTAPTPLRPGPVEVLVASEPTERATGGKASLPPLGDVVVEAWSEGKLVARASAAPVGPEPAAARLARLELPELPEGGAIELRIALRGSSADGAGAAELRADVVVAPPISPFAEHWLVLTLPALAVLLVALRERRATRAARARACMSRTGAAGASREEASPCMSRTGPPVRAEEEASPQST